MDKCGECSEPAGGLHMGVLLAKRRNDLLGFQIQWDNSVREKGYLVLITVIVLVNDQSLTKRPWISEMGLITTTVPSEIKDLSRVH